MSADTPTSQFESLKSRYEELTRTDPAKAAADAVEALERQITELPEKLRGIRHRGYAFAADLEATSESLRDRWYAIATDLKADAARIAAEFDRLVETAGNYLTKAEGLTAKPETLQSFLPNINSQIDQIEATVESVKTSLRARFEEIEERVEEVVRQLTQIDFYLDAIEQASFNLENGEALISAAHAEWVETGRSGDDPDGTIYLTDQRLLFEQDEKTGKRLGLFGGKEVQEVKWIMPLNSITNVRAENKGLLGGKDMIYITANGADTTVEVKGGVAAKFWVEQIERAQRGDLDRV